ncbi:hypothetical protein CCZ01_08880 [Helicobacter monodelphidis]|uniref:hypothetical protein n=1 Tax=Helicobacter sp. 15-1451 TaxID=2004995 RepID=UPI000DCDB2CA|nr:hypothetical protein [Helicobacter sp. 15-1451]RAX56641.1 hypothetical protein CCZ01_08880 [Helicobacter sp. 15-1451]
MKQRYFSTPFLSYFYSDDEGVQYDERQKFVTKKGFAGRYPIDIIESASGVQDKNGYDIYASDIVRLQGFKKPLVVKYDEKVGFYLSCEWGETLCKAEFGEKIIDKKMADTKTTDTSATDDIGRLKDTLSNINPSKLQVIGNVRNHRFRTLKQVFTHRGYTSIIALIRRDEGQWLNGYVLFDKGAFFRIFPAFRDTPGNVNVAGFRNGVGSDFADWSENRTQLYTYEAFDFAVSIPITYAEFGYKSSVLEESGFEQEEADPFVVFGFSLSELPDKSMHLSEERAMQNIDEMIDVFEAKLQALR